MFLMLIIKIAGKALGDVTGACEQVKNFL